ncbi:armadillo repeat-containing protein 3 [Venturia canescens]|uniref:armadillo repeat-containing protein 3 n=1 Tax=Venturia canescens TaxID=32260 RepID=UPI001C9D0872|nr:armadillo repeat-containing protein 3 [Venturia canescens]
MVQPNDDDCISTGKEREDRNASTKNRFELLHLEVKCPDTAILLLGSRERPVLVAAAAALTKFAAKGKENLQKLFELDIVDSLIPLVSHEDLFTRRFAARLLGEMTAIPFVKNYLLESDVHLPMFTRIAIEDSDNFMKEYASLILAEISKDAYGAAKLLENCTSLDFLFENLKILDPDVKKNNIQIIDNLLKDLTGAEKIIESQAFSFPLICELLDEPYPEIQTLSLAVLGSLLARSKDERIQQLFRQSGALRTLLKILDNAELFDIHADVLKVFLRAVENPITIETLISDGGVPNLFQYFETATNSQTLREILSVLVHLGDRPSGREMLHSFGLVKHLLQNLHGTSRDQELKKVVCYGIGMMARYAPSCKEILQEAPTQAIFDILKDETLNWPVRMAAAFTFKELCSSDLNFCQHFLDLKVPNYLQWLLKETPENVPLEVAIMAIDVLTYMGGYPDYRKLLLESELIDALCSTFEVKNRAADELKIASCRALSNFCVDKRTREICIGSDLVEKLFLLLSDTKSTRVRAAVVQLVQQLVQDPDFAEQFVHAGYLNYMLKNRDAAAAIPTWNTCIDSLFSVHLPTKFAVTGRLSLHETTDDGFYVMRRHVCPFPVLDELFRLKMCPKDPIYVVNFVDPRSSIEVKSLTTGSSRTESRDSTSVWLELKFGKLQKDPFLYDYLERFKSILAANEPSEKVERTSRGVVNVSNIASRAKLLGKFVTRQLSGPDPQNPCIDHQLEIHVREIREDIETSVIPLGQLRVGSYLERALLFKVLADRICLPSTLVRGEYGKAWNEIAIPQIESAVNQDASSQKETEERTSTSGKSFLAVEQSAENQLAKPMEANDSSLIHVLKDNSKIILPTSLLQENYVVDLMENPGDLIPINSSKARAYCAPIARCDMNCD